MTTLICAAIMVDDPEQGLGDAHAARLAGADLVEFRIDRLFHGEGDDEGAADTLRLVTQSPLPCIVTCRPTYEGGEYDGDDSARISLFESLGASDHPPRYIDVEHQAYARSANLRQKVYLAIDHPAQVRDLSTGLILSAHDFDKRPSDLLGTLASMRESEAAKIVKLAWRARSLRDNIELLELIRERDRPMIALGMGEFGLLSRVLAPKFGGFLTFAGVRERGVTAPGQPTIRELLETYRFRSIGAETRVYGVMGWPVAHSIGPQVHNAGFDAFQHDGVYLPMPIAEGWESFKATVLSLLDAEWLGFRGASVTIPHKEHLVRLAREDTSRTWRVDPLVERLGAANTISVQDDGGVWVSNTDAHGAIAPILRALERDDLPGVRVGVLGSGGAARAVLGGAIDAGADISVFARSLDKAKALVYHLGGRAHTLDAIGDIELDVLVNCTPLGMAGGPDPDASPIDREALRGSRALVMDTVYRPLETPLLQDSRELGLRVIDGSEMFVAQACAQFETWTGVPSHDSHTLFGRIARDFLSNMSED
ncbi:MAG: type I 3-dehydroquinate dehydratase [Planctomycetota bacterium]